VLYTRPMRRSGLVSALLVPGLLGLLGSLLSTSLLGCDFGTLDDLSQDETPEGSEEMTEQARGVWSVYAKPDEVVKRAIADLGGVIERAEAASSERPLKLKLGPIQPEQLGTIGFEAKDGNAAQGMLVAPVLDCTLDQVEKLVVAKNQLELYPGLYDEYARSYTSSVPDFLGGRSPAVTWRTDYKASAIGNTYLANLTGGARRVRAAAPDGKDVLLSRTYLNEPAKFVTGDDAAFGQDYQIELYWERTPGKTTHFYGLWREFRIARLTAKEDLYIALVLGNLVDFDVRTGKICRENSVAPKFE
jgi:hypothetical protein